MPSGQSENGARALESKRTVDPHLLFKRFTELRSERTILAGLWDQIDHYIAPLSDLGQPGSQMTESSVIWNRFELWEPAAGEGEWEGLDFAGVPLREAFFEDDSRGAVYRFYRLLSWSATQIKDLCDRKGWTCPEDISAKAALEGSTTERIEIVFCLFVRDQAAKELRRRRRENARKRRQRKSQADRKTAAERAAFDAKLAGRPEPVAGSPEDAVSPDEPLTPLSPSLRPVGGCYFRAANGEPIGDEVGYYEMPVLHAPWEKTTGSRWGHGPGVIALPTVKYLNAWMEVDKAAGEKVVDPAWGVTELGLLSDLNNGPGEITVFRSKDDVWVQESKANFAHSEKTIAELRQMIRDFFYFDQLQLKDSPQMTAEEAQIRYSLMQRILGAPLNSIESNLLSPMLRVCFGLALRAGRFPPMPPEVRQLVDEESSEISIEYLGPLARAQRTDKVAAIERLFAFAAALLKMGIPLPIIRAKLKITQAMDDLAKLLGVPNDLVESEEKAEKAISDADEMAKRAASAQIAEQEGKAAEHQAGARQKLAEAQTPRGGPRPVEPTAAQPGPLIGPSFQPTSPFAQPPTPTGA